MKAIIEISKSFDSGVDGYIKDWEIGDFEEFFAEEGECLDRLSDFAKDIVSDGFTVTYKVTLIK